MANEKPSTETYAIGLLAVSVFILSYALGQNMVPATAMAASEIRTGNLYVTSSPSGAFVYVDKVYGGETPVMIRLNEGAYSVIVSKKGYENYYGTITVSTGTTTLSASLQRQTSGRLP